MVSLSRIGTEFRTFVALASFLMTIGLAQPALSQEDDQGMDDGDEMVSISCDDGTVLKALFDEKSVELTLVDGSKIELPQKKSDSSFLYTNGKFTLSGDDASAKWTVGKKAPVACHFDEQQQPTHFDEPLTVDNTPLPQDKANPDAQPQVNCYRFAAFMVKEVDTGEKGAESLSIAPANAACERNPGKDDKPVKDDTAGYFFGAKGNFVFFQADDGWNGGLPFVVYDAKTRKRLFEDSLQGDDFDSLDAAGDTLTMTFRRVFSASCSLYLDGGTCAQAIKQETGLGDIAKLPDCGAAYAAEKKRTPDYAKEIEELPSVIAYQAQLAYDGKAVTIKPLKGETACNVPS